MTTLLWIVTIIGSVLGAIALLFAMFGVNGAPQQGALAAIAVGLAAIPYCLARAASELSRENRSAVSSAGQRKCQHCAEAIKQEAMVCRYCGRDVPAAPAPPADAPSPWG